MVCTIRYIRWLVSNAENLKSMQNVFNAQLSALAPSITGLPALYIFLPAPAPQH